MMSETKETTEKKYRKLKLTDVDRLAMDFTSQPQYIYAPPDPKSLGSPSLIHWREDFYIWRNGYYTQINRTEMRKKIVNYLMRFNISANDGSCDSDIISITPGKISTMADCVAAICHIPEATEPNSWIRAAYHTGKYVSVKNGLLKISLPECPDLLPSTPEYFTFSCLPYDYDENAVCPQWEAFLTQIMQGNQEYIRLLQQWAGYVLRNDLREQKFLLCTGEGANGKGVLFEIMAAMVGDANTSNIQLELFSDKFELSDTYGKIINFMSESNSSIDCNSETRLKAFVAGDRMTFQRKFKEPFSAVPTAKVMMSSNDPPRFNDKSGAIWRRIIRVPFNLNIPEEQWDKDLAEKLKKELSGILNWAIKGLVDLNKNGFIKPEGADVLIEEYRQDSDPCRAFLKEHYRELTDEDCPVDEIIKTDLYNHYKKYCEEGGYHALSDRNFGKQLKRTFPHITSEQHRVHGSFAGGSEGARDTFYKGIVRCS